MAPPATLNISQYGGDVNITELVSIAKNGVSMATLTFPDEGATTTSDLTLLGGFTAPANSQTQILNLSSFSVDPNSGSSAVFNIRSTNEYMSRQVEDVGNSDMEPLDTLDVQASVRDQYVFTSTTLGLRGMRFNGFVPAYVPGGHVVTATASTMTSGPSTLNATGNASGTGATTVTNNLMVDDPNGTIYGRQPVQTTIQALTTQYETFTLKAGSEAPDDETLSSVATGLLVRISTLGITDSSGNFLSDFVVDPTVYSIVKSFTTGDVYFPAGSVMPEGTTVALGAFINGDTVLNGTTVRFAYPYGNYPKLSFKFSRGSIIENQVDILDGYQLPGGQVVPAGSNTSDLPEDGDNLTLPDLIATVGFQLMEDTELTGVIPTDKYVTIPAGLTSRLMQPLLHAKTDTDLALQQSIYLPGTALESELTLNGETPVIDSINAAGGSIFKAGTKLYRGGQSIAGGLINGPLTIPSGTEVTDRTDISTPFVVNDSSTDTTTLDVGTVLKAPFQFPVGLHFPSGNTLPSLLKIVTSMGVTLANNMILAAGSAFGTNGTIFGNVGFSPTSTIPALSTLDGSFTFPAGTSFPSNFSTTASIPIPGGYTFPPGTIIPAGASFKEGASIPNISDITSQAGPASNGTTPAGPLSKTADGQYIIVKAHTTFLPLFKFPVGSVMSYAAGAGLTSSLTDAQAATGGTSIRATVTSYDLAPASYSLDEGQNAPGQDTFTFTCGAPTMSLVVMLADTTLPYDVLIPTAEIEDNFGSHLSFNEAFVLINDITLTNPYTVNGANNVYWPSGANLPADFTLTAPYTIIFNSSTISKPIQLNVPTSAQFVTGIMSSSASVKYPPAGYTLTQPIRLAIDQPVASSGANATKSFVTLAPGTQLMLAGSPSYVTLAVRMPVTTNFTVAARFDTYPRFELPSGIILLAGSRTPGDIFVGSGSPMPSNLVLTNDVILASDLTVPEEGYTLVQWSVLAAGSVLARETVFPEGAHFSDVVVSPILSLSTPNTFIIDAGEQLSSTIKQPYLFNTVSKNVPLLRVDARGLIGQIADLSTSNTALQGNVVALQGNIVSLQSNVVTLQGTVVTMQAEIDALQAAAANA